MKIDILSTKLANVLCNLKYMLNDNDYHKISIDIIEQLFKKYSNENYLIPTERVMIQSLFNETIKNIIESVNDSNLYQLEIKKQLEIIISFYFENDDSKVIRSFSTQYEFLSNFYIESCGISNENRYQSQKTLDKDKQQEIYNTTPGKSKRLGKKVKLREDWEQIKIKVMWQGLLEKFKDKKLQKKLLETGDKKLIEGNHWHDNFWGDCNCEKCINIKGNNVLGKLLMKLRDKFKNNNK